MSHAAVVKSYPEAFLPCRSDRHLMQHQGTEVGERVSFAVRIFQCQTCETVRTDTVHRATGDLIDRTYTCPDGYRLHGHGRIPVKRFKVRQIALELGF